MNERSWCKDVVGNIDVRLSQEGKICGKRVRPSIWAHQSF